MHCLSVLYHAILYTIDSLYNSQCTHTRLSFSQFWEHEIFYSQTDGNCRRIVPVIWWGLLEPSYIVFFPEQFNFENLAKVRVRGDSLAECVLLCKGSIEINRSLITRHTTRLCWGMLLNTKNSYRPMTCLLWPRGWLFLRVWRQMQGVYSSKSTN